MKEEEKKKSLSLFSAETLDSIAMAEVFGGADNCNGGNCVAQCGCGSDYGCNAKIGTACGTKGYCPSVFEEVAFLSKAPALGLSTLSYTELL